MSHGTKLTKQKNLSSFFSMMAKVCGVFVRFGFSLKNETAPFFSVSELAQVCLLLLDSTFVHRDTNMPAVKQTPHARLALQ